MSPTSQTRRCQKKVETKENAKSYVPMCTFSVTQEITNSGSNETQTGL